MVRVQEVTKALTMAPVPLAPKFVHGLINLRGQISTAISLRALFQIPEVKSDDQMNVVCRIGDVLVSFVVDRIGDVMELEEKDYETPPETIPVEVRRFVEGVYKTPGMLLSVIDVDKVGEFFASAEGEAKQIEK